jgi:hypothetical protein
MKRAIISMILLVVLNCFGETGNFLKNSDFSAKDNKSNPSFWELRGARSAFSFDSVIATLDNTKNSSEPLLLIQRELAVKAGEPWEMSFLVQGTGKFTAYVEWTLPGTDGIQWRNVIIEEQQSTDNWQQHYLRFTPETGFQAMKVVLRAEKGAQVMFSNLKLIKGISHRADLELAPSAWKMDGISNVSLLGEGVHGEITAKENSLTSGILSPAVPADEVTSIQFQMQLPPGISDQVRLYWRNAEMKGFVNSRSIVFPVKNNGELQYYNFKVPAHPDWSGNIVQFKLVPAVDPQKFGPLQLNNFKIGFSGTMATVAKDAVAAFEINPAKFVQQKSSYPKEMFNEAGAVLVNGQPQFVLGSVPAMVPGLLREMEEAGFNHISFPETFPAEWICKELKQTGLGLEGYLPPGGEERAAYKARVEAMWQKLEPSVGSLLLFWHSTDESVWRKIPVESTALLYDVIRELRPRRPVVVTHAPRNTIEELTPYSRQGDIVCVDIYPVPVGYHSELKNKTMSCVGEYADKTLKTATPEQPLWMWLQAYSRGGYPDFHQTRFMAYNAIMHGTMGILYYGLEHVPWPDNPMWPVLKKFGPELRALNAVLVAPWQTPLENKEGVELRIKRTADGQIYIFAANTIDMPRTLQLRVPESLRTLYADFAGRKITAVNGEITDRLEPYAVRIYSSQPKTIPVIKSKLAASELTVLLDGPAQYIWYEKHRRNTGKTIWFRRGFELESTQEKAGIVFSGDSNYRLYCNGQLVGEDWNFSAGGRFILKYYDLKPFLKKGQNVIAVESRHDTGNAGLWGEIWLGNTMLVTNDSWRCMDVETKGWNQAEFNDKEWPHAKAFGAIGGLDYYLRYFLIREQDLQKLNELRKNHKQ